MDSPRAKIRCTRIGFEPSIIDSFPLAESMSTAPRKRLWTRQSAAGQSWPEVPFRPWWTSTPRGSACHPKDRSEAENARGALTRRTPRRSRHPCVPLPSRDLRDGAAASFVRRVAVKRRVRPQFVVEIDPGSDDALRVAAVGELAQARRLVLQRTPQALDEDVVKPVQNL